MTKATAILLVIFCSVFALAQTDRGAIRGSVLDPTGAVLSGARVTATDQATGIPFSTVADSSGQYSVPALPPGIYRVTVQMRGFKTATRDGVIVALGQVVDIGFQLNIGSETQTVTVSTASPILVTSQSDVSTEISTDAYMSLPLSAGGGRNATAFSQLVPGVTGGASGSVNGGASNAGDFQVDGISTQTGLLSGDQRNIRFPPDAIEEMSLVGADYEAQYGETTNGIERYVLKSGTNVFHGSAYEYFKNTVLDARGYFNQTTPIDRQNEFGFTFGGPVILPHLYHGRNRTFFFFNGDFYRTQGGGGTSIVSLPNDFFRSGDFSQLLSTGRAVYDPATTHVGPDGNVTRDPFPGNKIPEDRISQVAQNILSFVPHATTDAIVNNATLPNSRSYNRFSTYTIDGQHAFNARNHLNLSYVYSHNPTLSSTPLPYPIGNQPLLFDSRYLLARLSYDLTLKPNLLNQLTLGYNRQALPYSTSDFNQDNWFQKLGLQGYDTASDFFPWIAAGPYGWAYYHNSSQPTSSTYVLNDALLWTIGSHNLRFGFEGRLVRSDTTQLEGASIGFSANQTGDPQNLGPTGNEFASFLLGEVNNSTIPETKDIPTEPYWYDYAVYAQDNYKVNSRLVLNYGIRLSLWTPFQDRHNRYSIMDLAKPNPDAGNLPGAYVFAGRDGQGDRLSYAKHDLTLIGPRLGAAYKISDRMVTRLGYGISYAPTGIFGGGNTQIVNDGYWVTSNAISPDGFNPAFTLDSGFPQGDIRQPVLTPSLNIGNNVTYWDSTADRGIQSQSWNVTLQREIAPNTSFQIAYIGTKATYIPVLTSFNQVNPEYLRLGDAVLRSPIDSAAARNAGIDPPWPGFSAALGQAATVAQALRPFPQYLGGYAVNTQNIGNSTYNALQVEVNKRMSNGLYLLSHYTWSKGLTDASAGFAAWGPYAIRNSYDLNLDKTVGSYYVPSVFVAAFIYELPFGPGKRFWGLENAFGNELLSGWQISGTLDYQSGANFGVHAPNTLPIFAGGVTADIVPGVRKKGTWTGEFNPYTDRYLNINAFHEPAPDTFGTSKQILPDLRGPVSLNENVGLAKNFPITETIGLQLRLEAFNLFNRVQFAVPNTDITNPSGFGQITGQANAPRNAQIVAKIHF